MATAKTAKVDSEIVKVKEKISEYQAKLRELEHKKTGIENTEIVDIVRGMSIPLDELAVFLKSLNGGSPSAAAYGQNVHKQKDSKTSEPKEDKEL